MMGTSRGSDRGCRMWGLLPQRKTVGNCRKTGALTTLVSLGTQQFPRKSCISLPPGMACPAPLHLQICFKGNKVTHVRSESPSLQQASRAGNRISQAWRGRGTQSGIWLVFDVGHEDLVLQHPRGCGGGTAGHWCWGLCPPTHTSTKLCF